MGVTIRVTHYGPKVVPDFDHTTSVVIQREGFRDQFIGLDSDKELGLLIEALQKAKAEADD